VAGLLAIAQGLARNASLWPEMGRPVRRTWALMASSDDFEAWLVAWPPGGAIELHDHGDAAGALVVASGELVETSITRGDGGPVRPATAVVRTGESLVFGAEHVHDVVNAARAPALSVHVYAPRLTSMTFYEIVGARLEPSRVVNYRLGEAIP
jgi:mannose-6-phosphate isomerase-like protein (cupin superfamily)